MANQLQPQHIFQELYNEFGSQKWWPVADKPLGRACYRKRKQLKEFQRFEVCVGAILTQNTAWRNVQKAIENLKKSGVFSLKKISNAKPKQIALLIKPSGYFNQKTRRLQLFCRHVLQKHGSLKKMFKQSSSGLRKELLGLHGIGNETADSMRLYAGQQPVFMVDAYTQRICRRYYGNEMNYLQAQAFFETRLPKKTGLFNEFHALLVQHAQKYCQPKPNCKNCFLKKSCYFG